MMYFVVYKSCRLLYDGNMKQHKKENQDMVVGVRFKRTLVYLIDEEAADTECSRADVIRKAMRDRYRPRDKSGVAVGA